MPRRYLDGLRLSIIEITVGTLWGSHRPQTESNRDMTMGTLLGSSLGSGPSTTMQLLPIHNILFLSRPRSPKMFFLSRFSVVHNRQKYHAKRYFRLNERKTRHHPRRASEYEAIPCAGSLIWLSLDILRPGCNTAALVHAV